MKPRDFTEYPEAFREDLCATFRNVAEILTTKMKEPRPTVEEFKEALRHFFLDEHPEPPADFIWEYGWELANEILLNRFVKSATAQGMRVVVTRDGQVMALSANDELVDQLFG